VKSVSAFFVFLAAFFFVAGYLGGGSAGLVWAGLIAVFAAVLYLLFYGWTVKVPGIRRLLEREPPPEFASAPSPPNGEGLFSTVSAGTRSAQRKGAQPRPDAPKQDPTPTQARGVRGVCDSGPYDVESGRPTKIPLEVEPGFTLVGTLEERDGDDFEFMIVDEDNWVSYQQGRNYDAEDEDYGESVYKIDWKVPSGGPWFLVLEAYGKQLVRVVLVNLRLSRP
jgi:hypothetical protein